MDSVRSQVSNHIKATAFCCTARSLTGAVDVVLSKISNNFQMAVVSCVVGAARRAVHAMQSYQPHDLQMAVASSCVGVDRVAVLPQNQPRLRLQPIQADPQHLHTASPGQLASTHFCSA